MTLFKLTFRSLCFYRRAHALVLAGTVLATAILVGALLVGDSIRFSLTQSALLRLGTIHTALESRGRFFPADLATRLQNEAGGTVSPALLFRGLALHAQGPGSEPLQSNGIQILGVQESFWTFAAGPKPVLSPEGIAVNARLAEELHLRCGDSLSIRFSKPALMSRDAPLSTQEKQDTLRATFTVEAIVQDSQLGRFSLAAHQQSPCTVFLNLAGLQETAGLPGQANLLLAEGPADLNQTLRKVWRLADAGLTLNTVDEGRLFQLECARIFMDPQVGTLLPHLPKSVGALTYLVNSIARTGSQPRRETPYSFVIALSPSADSALGLVPPEMNDDEIMINRWLADQLAARPGDTVTLSYYTFSTWNQFTETNRVFTVRRIAEMAEFAPERILGPAFPGLTDAGRCAEWDIGMPLKRDSLEDPANAAYWDEYRATPKAMVTLKAGQAMWANPFGALTAVRFRANEGGAAAITEALEQHLNPAELGLTFHPHRETALKAATEAMDFGPLFLGMSFFLIVASLMLTGLLFAFGVQQRAEETGVLLAVGLQPRQILRLWIQECILLAAAGSLIGAMLGTGYTRALIWGLSHFWQGAVARADIQYHATYTTIVLGALASFGFTLFALTLAIRRQTRQAALPLLSGESTALRPPAATARKPGWASGLPLAGLLAALLLIGAASTATPSRTPAYFFAAGSLLLVSQLGLAARLFSRLAQPGGRLTLLMMGLRNTGRHPARSLTAAGLLACGGFLILTVCSMQEDIGAHATRRDSGTGGFALYGETTLPLHADLSRPEDRARFNLDLDPDLKAAGIVSMKVREGDDASCLNLTRAQTPTLIGVDPRDFQQRGAFQLTPTDDRLWRLLATPCADGSIPGLAGDANTATWGLKKKTGALDGDTLLFKNERGIPFRVKLVGTLPVRLSVFQGSILISTRDFAAQFPSESGARRFLIDTRPGTETRVRNALSLKLEKWGLALTSTPGRLRLFYTVESTYMAMFLVLGGLGLLLGTAGLTILILRNIQERRPELALLSATGYTRRQILMGIWAEQGLILGTGLVIGATSSLAAIWPSLQGPGVDYPQALILMLVCGMLLFQMLWMLLAIRIALRAPLREALRNQ